MKRLLAPLAAAAVLGSAQLAGASCHIHNDTGYSFTVESGNTSNQRVGSHTTTTIAPGKVIAKSDDGKASFGGMCQDGQSVEVKEQGGVVVMLPK
jgi:hypothetical protein